jgi:hypothetical protein
LGVLYLFDARNEIAHLACRQTLDPLHLWSEDTNLGYPEGLAAGHQNDSISRPNAALHHPDEHDDPSVRIVPRVEDQRFEGSIRVSLRGRYPI